MIRHMTMMAAALAVMGVAGPAAAQAAPADVSGSVSDLRTEMTRRYDAALALTIAPEVIAADNSRFLWASEAKVACGIAIGYLKHGTRDAETIARCRTFSDTAADESTATWNTAPTQVTTATDPVPPVQPGTCPLGLPVAVYFDWDQDSPPAEAQTMATQIATSMAACNLSALSVVGYADLSGTDGYNLDLSKRRADNVARVLVAAGVPMGNLRVDGRGENDPAVGTADGVREPKNRRVQIDAATGT